jgi:hypothetical protein
MPKSLEITSDLVLQFIKTMKTNGFEISPDEAPWLLECYLKNGGFTVSTTQTKERRQ